MSEMSFFFLLSWWVLLLISIILILREMIKWFRRRTATLERWADAPRLEPPEEEISGAAAWLQSLSKDKAGLARISLEVSDAITDRVSLILGLQKDELRKLSLEEDFVRKTFGDNAAVPKYFSQDWLAKSLLIEPGHKATRRTAWAPAYLQEIRTMIEQLSRWEKSYESSRGI